MTPPRRVVVCGAGVVGASVAYFLARRGVAVTVIERTGVACAASGKSGGFLALDWCDGTPVGPLARASFALHAELARELETDYGYRRMETFMVAARQRGAVAGGHRVGAPSWLDGAGVVTAALGSTETTAQVQPARFTGALVDAATKRGATLRIGVVEEIVQRDGAAHGVRVGGETIEADAVVLAMGPWTSRAARGLRLPAVHGLKGYSVTLAGAEVPAHARRQACYRPVTDDGLPLIGRIPGVAGAYVATGHGPWGMLNAPATGLALAELIVDGTASLVDLRPFDPARRRT